MSRLLIIIIVVMFLECIGSNRSSTHANMPIVLSGDWIIIEQSVSPLMIAPRCKPIQKGSFFRFTQDSIKVHTDVSAAACDVFTYKAAGNTISIIKEDMLWLCTYELQANILKLKSDVLFTPYHSNKSTSSEEQATLNQVIRVTLIKR